MFLIESVENFVEDLLMLEGEPTLLLRVEADEPSWELVFPMGREVHVQRAVQKHRALIQEKLGADYFIVPRTILYHLALERFAALVGGDIELVSTNITNIKKPHTHKVREYGSEWLGYDVDCIAVGLTGVMRLTSFSEAVTRLADLFNRSSRYLRLEKVGVAAVANRTSPPPRKISRQELAQPPDAGVPGYLREHFAARVGRAPKG